jgi:hypothetical protein
MKLRINIAYNKLRDKISLSPLVFFLLPFSLSLLLLLPSCVDPFPEKIDYNEGAGVFICNEGNMTFGNASLSFFDPSVEEVKNQVFYNTNEFPIGDVLQSMTIIDSLGFLMINNSGKIFVFNTRTMLHEATISELTSPRYMLAVSSNSAYISDLYSRSITIINPLTFEKTGSILVGNSTEEMVMVDGSVYVCSWSFNNMIYKIDASTNMLSDSLEVNMQPNSLVVDSENKIWVLSDGGYPGMSGGESATLTRINPETFSIDRRFEFSDRLSSPTELSINPTKDTLYFLNNTGVDGTSVNGVFQFSIDAMSLPYAPLIESKTGLFYGLGVDPFSGAIYVSDAIDHIQRGWVGRYSSGGSVIDSFKVDIIPGEFCFKTE